MIKFLLFTMLALSEGMFMNYSPKFFKKPVIKERRSLIKLDNPCQLFDKLLTPELKESSSKIIVKSLSNTLPQFDSISHIVLNTNSKIIAHALENDFLPDQLKKDIILLTIKMTQEGDNMGGQILELYYNIVNHIL